MNAEIILRDAYRRIGTLEGQLTEAAARIQSLKAELAAVRAQPVEWQPIETAPKDELVDILLKSGRRYAGCHYDKICREFRHITACGVLVRLSEAAYWMLIPKSPAALIQPPKEAP